MPVEHNLAQVVHQVRLAGRAIVRNRPAILRAVGVQVLSWAHQDYRVKARHGTAPNGIKWTKITRDTIANRLRKLASYRAASRERKRQMIDEAMGNHEIGVDTGRLVNSLKAADRNNVQVATSSVTVGAQVKYAVHFDAMRPIFGDNFITVARANALDRLVERMGDKAAEQELN